MLISQEKHLNGLQKDYQIVSQQQNSLSSGISRSINALQHKVHLFHMNLDSYTSEHTQKNSI